MLRSILIGALAVAAAGLTIYMMSETKTHPLRQKFASFIKEHKKTVSSPDELEYRFAVYQDNHAYSAAVNARQNHFVTGENPYFDLTFEEFSDKYLSKQIIYNNVSKLSAFGDPAKGAKDWRELKAVNQIKNQGRCGSCWAFSAVAAFEAALVIQKKATLTQYSEQELVDCSGEFGNQGCEGGLMNQAFDYIKEHKLSLSADYPYVGADSKCHRNDSKPRETMKEYKTIDPVDVCGLVSALEKQPVSVAIEVQRDFQMYKSGVYHNDDCGSQLNHGVAAIGYVNKDGEDNQYFIVRNSWGEKWGEKGYVRMFIGSGSGTCGIANESDVYPIIN